MVINKTTIGLISDDFIESISAIKINNFNLNLTEENNLYDLKMGCINKNHICQTCYKNIDNCTGHYGHIELNNYYYNPLFIKHLAMLLSLFCLQCNKCLVNEQMLNENLINQPNNNFRFLIYFNKKLNIKKKCVHCNYLNYEIKVKMNLNVLYYKNKNDKEYVLDIEEVYKILNEIDDKVYLKLGIDTYYSHPKNIIFKNILVPPNNTRPINYVNNILNHNHLTLMLNEILIANKNVSKLNSKIYIIIKKLNDYFTINKDVNKINIFNIMMAKNGLIKKYIYGKRQNNSARGVITGDIDININEVGIPIKISKNLSINETITEDNIDYYTNKPNCIKYIKRNNNEFIFNKYCDKNFELNINDIIKRDIRNGDYVLLNRQPTLGKTSIMTHKVKIIDGNAIKINPSTTIPYGADFDGDEMNIHVLDNDTCINECVKKNSFLNNFVSDSDSNPITGLIQDSIVGIYKITQNNIFLNKNDFIYLLNKIKKNRKLVLPVPYILKPEALWTGKQLLEILLPNDLYYEKDNILIKNGKILNGIFDSNIIGKKYKSLFHILWLDYDVNIVNVIMNNMQIIANNFLEYYGHSITFDDFVFPTKIFNEINKIELVIDKTYEKYDINNFVDNSILLKSYEFNMYNNVFKNMLDINNNFYNMIISGSKGSFENYCQIVCKLFQQIVNGSNFKKEYSINRTLPLYEFNLKDKNEILKSRGYIKNNYLNQLTHDEYFIHAIVGRNGLINTYVKTGNIGYTTKKFIMNTKNIIYFEDYIYELNSNKLISKLTKNNNMNNKYLELVQIKNINFNNDILKYFNINTIKTKNYNMPFNIDRFLCKFPFEIDINIDKNKDFCICFIEHLMKCYNLEVNNNIIIYIIISLSNYYTKISYETLEKLCTYIYNKYKKSLYVNYNKIGLLITQTIMKPITQISLDSFHNIGLAKSAVDSFDTFKNILLKKKQTINYISFNLNINYNDTIKNKLLFLIEAYTLGNIINSIKYKINDNEFEFEFIYDIYKNNYKKISNYKHCYTISLNKKDIINNESLSCLYILNKLNNITENIFVMIDSELTENEYIILLIYSNTILSNEYIHSLNLSGFENVINCNINNNKLFVEYNFTKTNFINNLMIEIYDYIDINTFYTNDYEFLYKYYGIEIVHDMMLYELKSVFNEFSISIDNTFLVILLDKVCRDGVVKKFSMSNIYVDNYDQFFSNILSENLKTILVKASMSGCVDKLKGISEKILFSNML